MRNWMIRQYMDDVHSGPHLVKIMGEKYTVLTKVFICPLLCLLVQVFFLVCHFEKD